MRVLIVNGGRRGGNTDRIARQFAKGAQSAGHEVRTEYLVGKKMSGCIDCQRCQTNGGTCIWKDDLPPVFEELLAADVLVFACPVYYYGITGQLKTFMDRTFAWQGRVKGKRLYFVTSCAAPCEDPYKDKVRYAIDSVAGYADCFGGEMELVRTICGWGMFQCEDVTRHPAFREAEEAGAAL